MGATLSNQTSAEICAQQWSEGNPCPSVDGHLDMHPEWTVGSLDVPASNRGVVLTFSMSSFSALRSSMTMWTVALPTVKRVLR